MQDKRTVARRLAEAEAMPALQAVYRKAEFNLRVRVDAAKAALQYEVQRPQALAAAGDVVP